MRVHVFPNSFMQRQLIIKNCRNKTFFKMRIFCSGLLVKLKKKWSRMEVRRKEAKGQIEKINLLN